MAGFPRVPTDDVSRALEVLLPDSQSGILVVVWINERIIDGDGLRLQRWYVTDELLAFIKEGSSGDPGLFGQSGAFGVELSTTATKRRLRECPHLSMKRRGGWLTSS
jgi:hypothetical protein